MRRPVLSLLLAAAGGLLALAATAAPAAADPTASGLDVTVRAADPLAPVVVLTNRTATPCQVVAMATGTLSLTQVAQDGHEIAPVPIFPNFADDLGVALTRHLKVLDPGASVELPLRTVAAGATGHAIETVAWSSGLTIGALYPVAAGTPLSLQVLYAAPITPQQGPALCTMTGPSRYAVTATARPWLLYGAIGAGVVLLLLGGLALVLLLRRRRKGAAVAVAILVAGGLLAIDWAHPTPAAARPITPDASIADAVNGCLDGFRQPGHDPRGILPALEQSPYTINVLEEPGDNDGEYKVANTIFIHWNPNDHGSFTDGVAHVPCDELYHELYHAFEDIQNQIDLHECFTPDGKPTGISIKEVHATQAENDLRRAVGDQPRGRYGYNPLPDQCRPPRPEDPLCHPERGCPPPDQGRTSDDHSDPHLRTFDGRRYDFMAVGEFVAVRDTAAPDPKTALQVQTRQSALGRNPYVAVNSATAMNVVGDRVEVRLDRGALSMLVNGAPTTIASMKLPKGGDVIWVPPVNGGHPRIVVDWPDQSYAIIQPNSPDALRVLVWVPIARAGKLAGLLGDANGDPANDLRVGSAAPIGDPAPFEALYPGYADSLRITNATSLFTYPPGTSTETYTDRSFPQKMPPPSSSPRFAWAEAICRAAGVSEQDTLAACIVDVINTGQAEYAVAASVTQATVSSFAIGGATATLRIANPGDVAKVTFAGTAGQKMYVEVASSTLPDECSVLELRDPADKGMASGCIIGGKGRIDAVILPVTGTYTIVLDPHGNQTGEAVLRLVSATDQTGALVPDGPAVTATISAAGGVAALSFEGTAGETVFVDAPTSTLPDQCSVLELRDAADHVVASGCVIGGTGFINAATLERTGTYRVVVDPSDTRTGVTQLRLIVDHDQQGAMSVNGAEVVSTVAQPGAVSRFTFAGSAGQRVFVVASASSLADQCGVLLLVDPAGHNLISGCVIGGKGGIGGDSGYVLPATGQYTLLVDPEGRRTGETHLRIHT